MTSIDSNLTKMKKYAHASKTEFDTFLPEFTDILNLHKDKLDTPLKDNKLNPIIERKVKLEARAEAKADALETADIPPLIAARVKESLSDALRTGFSLLMQCISSESLKEVLRDTCNHDVHKATEYIKSVWSITDNETRIAILVARRRDFMDEGLTKLTLATEQEFADKMAKLNLTTAS